jgi:hypothetical protein
MRKLRVKVGKAEREERIADKTRRALLGPSPGELGFNYTQVMRTPFDFTDENFVLVNGEVMRVTGIQGRTLTVRRGQ